MSDLFAPNQPQAPLAEQLRPKTLDEVVGQTHLLGQGKPLRLAFQSGKLPSMILWGPPGVGKTTLARALMGLVPVHEGHFVFAGQRIQADQPQAWRELRRQVQMVFQDPFGSLDPRWNVHDLIAEPLRLQGQAQGPALTARVQELLQQVGLPAEAASRYPHQFSGGQRQRIAIARVILKDAPILVLDEATSALDSQSEHEVQQAMERVCLGRTSLVIAHRMSTIEHADRIVVMQRGRIAESGSHAELMAREGLYARLYRIQFALGQDVAGSDAASPDESA